MLVTSQSLLERLQDRADSLAWQRLLSVYEPWLRGWLSRAELQPADRDDVLQDVLVVVNQKLPDFRHNGQPGAFRSWLRLILTNRVRQFLRGRQRQHALVALQPLTDWLDQLSDPDSDLSRQWDQEHDRQLARQVLAATEGEFSATTWRAFRMLVLEEVPAAEVARAVGLTPNAVYIAKSRVLARLRAELRGLMDA